MTTARDWTNGPAKWGAAMLLAAASIGGMAWSMSGNRKPVMVTHADRADPKHLEPVPESAPPPTTKAPPAPAPETRAPVITVPAAPAPHLVNLNTATQAELELLPGIGPAMAKRILDYRAQHGKFTSVDQLDGVKGIGTKTMAKLRPLVSVD